MAQGYKLIKKSGVPVISEPSNALTLQTLLNSDASDGAISVTEVEIMGEHQSLQTNSQLRTYYLISGNLEFTINDEGQIFLSAGDLLTLTKGAKYSLVGNAKYLVINTPAFKAGDDIYLI